MGKRRVIVREFKLKKGLLVSGSWNMGQKTKSFLDLVGIVYEHMGEGGIWM